MNNIGELMAAAEVLQKNVESPVQQLRKEISLMQAELIWHESKHPEADTSKRRERLQRLELICRTLEDCEPVSLMPIIRDKLAEAKREKFEPDCAAVWLPLKPNVPDLLYARPAIIDLIGWEIHSIRDYDLVGLANAGGFICSQLND